MYQILTCCLMLMLHRILSEISSTHAIEVHPNELVNIVIEMS
jgi:hypothetical protein